MSQRWCLRRDINTTIHGYLCNKSEREWWECMSRAHSSHDEDALVISGLDPPMMKCRFYHLYFLLRIQLNVSCHQHKRWFWYVKAVVGNVRAFRFIPLQLGSNFTGNSLQVVFASNAVLFANNQGTETWVSTDLQELHLNFAHKVACMFSPDLWKQGYKQGASIWVSPSPLVVPTPQTELLQGE